MGRIASLAELRAGAEHANLRLALYRRRVYLGRGDPGRLPEYERVAHGAAERLRHAEERARAEGGASDAPPDARRST